MTEVTTREIIGISHRSNWNKVKEFLYELVKKTLKNGSGYVTVVLDASISKQKKQDHHFVIQDEKQAAKILRIGSFSDISLYQYSDLTADNILISKENDVIIVMAKYMGIKLDHEKYFDFSMHTGSIGSPHFSNSSGKVIDCSEIIKLVNFKEKKAGKTRPKKGGTDISKFLK